MKQRDIPQGENMTDQALEQWAQAFGYVATRYRVACSRARSSQARRG